MVRNQRDARGVVRRKGDGVQALHSQQQRPDLGQARGDHHAQRHQRGGQHQPTGQAQARQPSPLSEEPADLDHHRHGPQQADDRLAVAQAVKVEREKHVERDVRQDVEEHRRKEPAHHRLPQQRPDSRVIGVVVHRLLVVGQPPHAGHHGGQRGQRPGGEVAQAEALEPPARHHHRDQKTQRAPEPHATVAPGVKRAPLADQVRQRRLAHRHHGAGVGEHEQQHHEQGHWPERKPQRQRKEQRRGGAVTQQFDALTRAVAQRAPGVGREQARGRLHRGQHADGKQPEPQVLEPERQIGIEKADVREVARGQGGKRQELLLLLRHDRRPQCRAWSPERHRTARGGAAHGPSPPEPAALP